MAERVRRIFVEKKAAYAVEAGFLLKEFREFLGVEGLEEVRVIHRYDIEGITKEVYEKAKKTIFAELPVDVLYEEEFPIPENYHLVAIESLPGQYDQRADMAGQTLQLLTGGKRPEVRYAKLVLLAGDISREEYLKIKSYCINPLESREASLDIPATLKLEERYPEDVNSIENFNEMTPEELETVHNELGLAMSLEDLLFIQTYFQGEKRNPTLTEIRVLDTYWSDHCRHTTFLTELVDIEIRDGFYSPVLEKVYERYLESRDYVYGGGGKNSDKGQNDTGKPSSCVTLMDLATIGMKELKKKGLLDDLDESEEINACSIKIKVEVDGKEEDWLLMFKNETHNHPTEMEPFGGAATCLGGAIRDPLSGRAYVYQAMRVSGSGDPRTPIEKTMEGKLPQRKISTGAALGYSTYGNQIGIAAGQVAEIYHDNFQAKRLECGAVIAAAPAENVVRKSPEPGDLVILLGGRTGRDGCGGATGSSRKHDEESLASSGAEVQKGNPLIERNIQHLFRKPEVSRMIKKCNDFGAGGVSVAIGELADSLDIDLDAVPVKYEGLDGTELAISESQERMAVVIGRENLEDFLAAAREENLEATPVAVVTDTGRLRMKWRDKIIVDMARDFLDTNGVTQKANITLISPEGENYLQKAPVDTGDLKDAWLKNLASLNACSQKGLIELFDNTVGGRTVFLPFGGKRQLTPVDGMVAKIPVQEGDTTTASIMTYAYDPELFMWSTFHGGVYSLVHAVAKSVALGGDYKRVRLSLQEYFGSPGRDSIKWGKPFSALLGAYLVQSELAIPAIGGKDSISGTYKDLDVPPTLIAFAVNTVDANKAVSPEFKEAGNRVIWVRVKQDKYSLPDFTDLKEKYERIHRLINDGKVLAASAIHYGGVAATISKMCFGNELGFTFNEDIFSGDIKEEDLFLPDYASLLLELKEGAAPDSLPDAILLGETSNEGLIKIGDVEIRLDEALESWAKPLADVYSGRIEKTEGINKETRDINIDHYAPEKRVQPRIRIAKPTVFIPVFPGTGGEDELAHKFMEAGAKVDEFVFKNLDAGLLEESIEILAGKIKKAQILALPGGASAGDEPEGAGKFIATIFRMPAIQEAVMQLLEERDGLILGIGNGFQALIRLGLLPYGEYRELDEDSPTLSYNVIGRYVSTMVRTKVVSTLSPWLARVEVGSEFVLPVAHGEGRFLASEGLLEELIKKGQVATQYVDCNGNATCDIRYNPNGSVMAIEGITSPDGRIFGKMAHSERIGDNVAKNIPGDKDQKIFAAGVEYFI